jgi:sulfur relay (sulfurtransferase) DsrF/TusC family protein
MKKIFLPKNAGVSREMIYEDIQESVLLSTPILGKRDKNRFMVVEDVVLPFTKNQMPDDLCQHYVDDTYGMRAEYEDEEDFVDEKLERANVLRTQIVFRLKKKKKK